MVNGTTAALAAAWASSTSPTTSVWVPRCAPKLADVPDVLRPAVFLSDALLATGALPEAGVSRRLDAAAIAHLVRRPGNTA
jgi:hypothetical protein